MRKPLRTPPWSPHILSILSSSPTTYLWMSLPGLRQSLRRTPQTVAFETLGTTYSTDISITFRWSSLKSICAQYIFTTCVLTFRTEYRAQPFALLPEDKEKHGKYPQQQTHFELRIWRARQHLSMDCTLWVLVREIYQLCPSLSFPTLVTRCNSSLVMARLNGLHLTACTHEDYPEGSLSSASIVLKRVACYTRPCGPQNL
ncbi:hypothetical protein BC835DRAFT_59884 [Cytidiella melzeri]|nr:hypothetical protein BC835DRAFT_59884 [Cytidiella melzeri]